MRIHPEAQDRNTRLQAVAPAVLAALSPLGKRAFFPKGIPFQAGQASGCRINATIGQITDGAGNASFGSGTASYAVPAGHKLFTATATDPDGNTSEFSECFGIADLILHAGFETCSGFD